jgi:16S rRNA (cytosine1402-N4)-methyltransferase
MSEAAVLHAPVLLKETLVALAPEPGGRYCDGTLGLGGHAEQILLRSAPTGRLLGIDRDPEALAQAGRRLAAFGNRALLVQGSYADAAASVGDAGLAPLSGLLLDLGVSSLQLDSAERGFSFQREGPLDMRFDNTSAQPSAAWLVNEESEAGLADIIWRYGEEQASRRIARAIVRARPLRTTTELAKVVTQAIGRHPPHISPATRTFQALRIAVNQELEALQRLLDQAGGLLESGGRLVVLSFHSLEDRIVKQFIQRESRDCICPPTLPECRCGHRRTFTPLNRRPITPEPAELQHNPRSRSVKLRAAVRI